MNRLVNILMIAIIVSCPMRCMAQGCGCYTSVDSCCSIEKCACESSDKDSGGTPDLPQKCECKCFCSGVIVADYFVVPENQTTGPILQSIDTAVLIAGYRLQFDSAPQFHPPDILDGFTTNRGRQIRCLIGSLVI